ncbi:hypothetical protein G4Y79_09580 [Phototrophicus methaneseepsis]|uniref:Uncharacterized protein n=1 Tax=Phototrophicus methaneseepsis TaxID=2710758 RepID=A0A7S8ECV4_9CHLR|nr:hypothetical protein [Phototrophicus methaneseepsis]QPC84606.1 hypothetical protein G4Y79_09580 [Phototrophicus methaneseepsis]
MTHHQHFPWIPFIGTAFVVLTLWGLFAALPEPLIVLFFVVGGFILSAMALWQHANMASSDEAWWQDDQCSGWRGY